MGTSVSPCRRHALHHVRDEQRLARLMEEGGVHKPRVHEVAQRGAAHLQDAMLDLPRPGEAVQVEIES